MATDPDNIGVLVLAAGFSRRFDGDKRTATFSDGQTLLQATLASVPASFRHCTVVLRRQDDLATVIDQRWNIVFAENSAEGMGESLAAGIRGCSSWSGALIALGDMPYISTETWEAIRLALCSHGLVQPVYQDQPGHPVGFNSKFFSEIAELSGDEGARCILKENAGQVFKLTCKDEGVIRDIDRPGDLPAR